MKNLISVVIAFTLGLSHAAAQTFDNSYSRPPVQMKSHWFAGGNCMIERQTGFPEIVTFTTTVREHLTQRIIESCVAAMNRKPSWTYASKPSSFTDTLREARTQNMACAIIGAIQAPLVYQVTFSAFALTGKQKELGECMTAAAESKEKVRPPVPTREMSL